MNDTISKGLKTTFLVHMIVAAVLGLALWIVPGRVLSLVGWIPAMVPLPQSSLSVPGQTFVDPYITRTLGAALLALAFASFLGWRAQKRSEVAVLVQLDLAFCVLGLIAFLVNLIRANWAMPPVGWAFMVIFAGFAVAWGLALRR
jgi:hypothetical protein